MTISVNSKRQIIKKTTNLAVFVIALRSIHGVAMMNEREVQDRKKTNALGKVKLLISSRGLQPRVYVTNTHYRTSSFRPDTNSQPSKMRTSRVRGFVLYQCAAAY